MIGRAIRDDALDLARLGTGHVRFPNARFNAGVYDAAKLDGLRSMAVYDMAALRSTALSSSSPPSCASLKATL